MYVWKNAGRAFHCDDLNCELVVRDRKIQGMKLATAPLLCDLSPSTSVMALLCVCLLPIANKLAEKCRLHLLMGVSIAQQCGKSHPMQSCNIICCYMGQKFHVCVMHFK